MSDAPDKEEKTEAPSEKRLREAVRGGDVLQSRELATAAVMIAGAAWFAVGGRWLFDSLQQMLRSGLTIDDVATSEFHFAERAELLLTTVALPLLLLLVVTLFGAIATPALLGSLGLRGGALVPKASRINPIQGLARIFGAQGLSELAKSILKVFLLGAIAWWSISRSLDDLFALGSIDARRSADIVGKCLLDTIIALTGGLVVIGFVDAPIQWFRRRARLRMTKQQIRQEQREAQGSPEIKARIQRQRQELLSGSARKAVLEASVILFNPMHFAVALRYRPGIDAAPIVVARGRGETALAIRSLATERDIPRLEYPQLTRAIYFTTRAGKPVSPDLYVAVATILAFVFNLARGLADAREPPVVAVPVAKRFDAHGRRAT